MYSHQLYRTNSTLAKGFLGLMPSIVWKWNHLRGVTCPAKYPKFGLSTHWYSCTENVHFLAAGYFVYKEYTLCIIQWIHFSHRVLSASVVITFRMGDFVHLKYAVSTYVGLFSILSKIGHVIWCLFNMNIDTECCRTFWLSSSLTWLPSSLWSDFTTVESYKQNRGANSECSHEARFMLLKCFAQMHCLVVLHCTVSKAAQNFDAV